MVLMCAIGSVQSFSFLFCLCCYTVLCCLSMGEKRCTRQEKKGVVGGYKCNGRYHFTKAFSRHFFFSFFLWGARRRWFGCVFFKRFSLHT